MRMRACGTPLQCDKQSSLRLSGKPLLLPAISGLSTSRLGVNKADCIHAGAFCPKALNRESSDTMVTDRQRRKQSERIHTTEAFQPLPPPSQAKIAVFLGSCALVMLGVNRIVHKVADLAFDLIAPQPQLQTAGFDLGLPTSDFDDFDIELPLPPSKAIQGAGFMQKDRAIQGDVQKELQAKPVESKSDAEVPDAPRVSVCYSTTLGPVLGSKCQEASPEPPIFLRAAAWDDSLASDAAGLMASMNAQSVLNMYMAMLLAPSTAEDSEGCGKEDTNTLMPSTCNGEDSLRACGTNTLAPSVDSVELSQVDAPLEIPAESHTLNNILPLKLPLVAAATHSDVPSGSDGTPQLASVTMSADVVRELEAQQLDKRDGRMVQQPVGLNMDTQEELTAEGGAGDDMPLSFTNPVLSAASLMPDASKDGGSPAADALSSDQGMLPAQGSPEWGTAETGPLSEHGSATLILEPTIHSSGLHGFEAESQGLVPPVQAEAMDTGSVRLSTSLMSQAGSGADGHIGVTGLVDSRAAPEVDSPHQQAQSTEADLGASAAAASREELAAVAASEVAAGQQLNRDRSMQHPVGAELRSTARSPPAPSLALLMDSHWFGSPSPVTRKQSLLPTLDSVTEKMESAASTAQQFMNPNTGQDALSLSEQIRGRSLEWENISGAVLQTSALALAASNASLAEEEQHAATEQVEKAVKQDHAISVWKAAVEAESAAKKLAKAAKLESHAVNRAKSQAEAKARVAQEMQQLAKKAYSGMTGAMAVARRREAESRARQAAEEDSRQAEEHRQAQIRYQHALSSHDQAKAELAVAQAAVAGRV